ncbi:MAG: hypothetical protein HDS07_02295 [Bacteroides sp.]|nr:hypothetical protein [Bacteroides sp.]
MTSTNNTQTTSLGDQRMNLAAKINTVDQTKIELLSDKIGAGVKTLNEEYHRLEEISSPIEQQKYLGFIRVTKIEKSFENILKIIQGVANSTLTAFTTNGENLKAILELLRISISIENDLYRQLEECDCSKENTANLLNDLCSQYNIDNEAISGLFEQSFNRSLTLRAKINSVRDEVSNRILKLERDIENLETTLQSKVKSCEEDLKKQVAESRRQFESDFQQCINTIEANKITLENTKAILLKDVESAKKEMKDSINNYQSEFSKQSESRFELLNSELQKTIETLNNNIEKISKRSTWSIVISIVSIIIAIISITL